MSVAALKALTTIALTTAVLTLAGSAPAQTTKTQPIRVEAKKTVSHAEKKQVAKQQQAQLLRLANQIGAARRTTWKCQDGLGVARKEASTSVWALPPSIRYRHDYVLMKVWMPAATSCAKAEREIATALRTGNLARLSTFQLYRAADQEVSRGGIYGIGWGSASPLLKSLCYEAVTRRFGANGSWARFIVNRESGCNPSAQNTKYAACTKWSTCQRATGISQMIPAVHTWVDYDRVMRDLRYAVDVFYRLSNGGRTTGPWACC